MTGTVLTTMPEDAGPADALPALLGFTRALRAAGVPVTQDRSHAFLEATALVGLDDRRATYWAGRATLCAGPDDLARYDQVFEAWFDPRGELPRRRDSGPPVPAAIALPSIDAPGEGDADEDDEVLRAKATTSDVLRHRDVATLDAAEKQRLAAMFATLRPTAPTRRTARHEPWHRGRLDASRTLRDSLRRMGEPGDLAWRRRRVRPRRIVLLVDVSGSMSGYADALLRLAHRFVTAQPRVEVFTLGTRLTHVTRALHHRDPDRAIVAAGEAVPDWSGGTRLGETLRVFMDRWGQRGMARGSVVVVFSDGWERGDAALLGEQMARLQRVAHRVVWVNPHRGKAGYEPVQGGIAAALPHCDDFVAGHSLAAFAELVEVVGRA
ncbi:vWA domain-containing protein [Nocardioides sp. Soil777]|uniref:vWA domain-containing protein n=1 Tax=Nocardioides sp. Soil777 TaxID=1736409 RepID=UPI000A77C94A|nr:VWA domain-containing protein [Nocardioides sp. Soil777]